MRMNKFFPIFLPTAPSSPHSPADESADRGFFIRMKSTLTKRGLHVKSSGYKVESLVNLPTCLVPEQQNHQRVLVGSCRALSGSHSAIFCCCSFSLHLHDTVNEKQLKPQNKQTLAAEVGRNDVLALCYCPDIDIFSYVCTSPEKYFFF